MDSLPFLMLYYESWMFVKGHPERKKSKHFQARYNVFMCWTVPNKTYNDDYLNKYEKSAETYAYCGNLSKNILTAS